MFVIRKVTYLCSKVNKSEFNVPIYLDKVSEYFLNEIIRLDRRNI